MKIEIRNRFTDAVIYSFDASKDVAAMPIGDRLGAAVRAAVAAKINLRGANLRGANLRGANLRGANLGNADLDGSDLRGVNLTCADLANADLRKAKMRGAKIRGANLLNANLRGAKLRGADLEDIKKDMIAEIIKMPIELDALRLAVVEGRIDGSTYSKECSCLAGTLAKAHGETEYNGKDISVGALTFHADSYSPRELWFTQIYPGDTPKTNQCADIALEWIDEAIAIRDAIVALTLSKGK